MHIQSSIKRITHQFIMSENESNISPTAHAMGDSTSLTCHRIVLLRRATAASSRSRQNLMQTVLYRGVM